MEKTKTYYSGDTIEEAYRIPDDAKNVRLIISSKEGCYVSYLNNEGDEVMVGHMKDTVTANFTTDEEW